MGMQPAEALTSDSENGFASIERRDWFAHDFMSEKRSSWGKKMEKEKSN